MTDMTTTIREFQRQFRKIRQRAKAGEEILVTDASGVTYSFKAKRASSASFAEKAADLIGSYRSEKGDLASNPEHLRGYGGS